MEPRYVILPHSSWCDLERLAPHYVHGPQAAERTGSTPVNSFGKQARNVKALDDGTPTRYGEGDTRSSGCDDERAPPGAPPVLCRLITGDVLEDDESTGACPMRQAQALLPPSTAPQGINHDGVPTPAFPVEDYQQIATPGKALAMLPSKILVASPPEGLHVSTSGQSQQVCWKVDAKRLLGNDKQVVSQLFALSLPGDLAGAKFRLMLNPKASSSGGRGGAGFKRAQGIGTIRVKCETELEFNPAITYRLTLATSEGYMPWRGPFEHNFASNAVSALPKEHEEWNFSSAVDAQSDTFTVIFEMPLHTEPRSELQG